jgi:ribosome-binding protein aMBF1 (putative translation factor)
MLEPTKKPHTENVVLNVICDKAKLARVKDALRRLDCAVKQETALQGAGWYSIEDLFQEQRPGAALKAYRNREGLNQKQLADMVSISVPNLSHMEHGRRPIGKDMAKRLAKVLNTDWRMLLS